MLRHFKTKFKPQELAEYCMNKGNVNKLHGYKTFIIKWIMLTRGPYKTEGSIAITWMSICQKDKLPQVCSCWKILLWWTKMSNRKITDNNVFYHIFQSVLVWWIRNIQRVKKRALLCQITKFRDLWSPAINLTLKKIKGQRKVIWKVL